MINTTRRSSISYILTIVLLVIAIITGCGGSGSTRGSGIGGERPVRGSVFDQEGNSLAGVLVSVDLVNSNNEVVESKDTETDSSGDFELNILQEEQSRIIVRLRTDEIDTAISEVNLPNEFQEVVINISVNTQQNLATIDSIDIINSTPTSNETIPTVTPASTSVPQIDDNPNVVSDSPDDSSSVVDRPSEPVLPQPAPVQPTSIAPTLTPIPTATIIPVVDQEPAVPPTLEPTNVPISRPTSIPSPVQEFETISRDASELGRLRSDGTREWDGLVRISAFNDSGSQVNVLKEGNNRIAVGTGRNRNQIDFNPTTSSSESLVLEFLRPAKSMKFLVDQLKDDEFPPNNVNERGIWRAFNSTGNQIGSGIISTQTGTLVNNKWYEFGRQFSDLVASVTIEASAYSNPNGFNFPDGNSSDFSLRGITAEFLVE